MVHYVLVMKLHKYNQAAVFFTAISVFVVIFATTLTAHVYAGGGTIWARCQNATPDKLRWEKKDSTYRFTCDSSGGAVTTGADPTTNENTVGTWVKVTLDCGSNDMFNQGCKYDKDDTAAKNAVKSIVDGGVGAAGPDDVENVETSKNDTTADAGSGDLNKLLQAAIDTLAAAAGLIFVISFIIAGFQYLTARDNASQVAAAKERIFTLVITFILFVFGYGLLQWLVPGGIFS